jgi:hypothetical protein
MEKNPITYNVDLLIKLGQELPSLADDTITLIAIGDAMKDGKLKDFFQHLVDGMISVVNLDVDKGVFLSPLLIEGAELVLKHPDGSGNDLTAKMDSDGMYRTIWYTSDFMERLRFLRTGLISLSFQGAQIPPDQERWPISLRTDAEDFFQFLPTSASE